MKKIINTSKAPQPIGPYNQAIIHDNTLYISGQIALNPSTNELVIENIVSETNQVMKNLEAILLESGSDFSKVIKSSIFIKDMSQFGEINTTYGAYFDEENAPARETVEVSCLPKNVNIEISIIAFID